MKNEAITVSEFNSLLNQTLSFAYPEVIVEGEVASYKVNQGKWVFFDLKDDQSVVSCFMPIFHLKTKIEDGMMVRVKSVPQLTKWGKFSLTVREVELAGEGSVKRAFELLKDQLSKEGLFDKSRKRTLPEFPSKILLITSRQAAAYNDFITILADRWGGLRIDHVQVQVQGEIAADQISEAIEYANSKSSEYDVVVLIRGGGSAEDMQSFNTEQVVRSVFGSVVPIIVGIGHEDDLCLAELAADVRAATPTDAARRLVPDRKEVQSRLASLTGQMLSAVETRVVNHRSLISRYYHSLELRIASMRQHNAELMRRELIAIDTCLNHHQSHFSHLIQLLSGLDPNAILARGYSIARVHNRVIKSVDEIQSQDLVMLQLHKGRVTLKITREGNNEQDQTTIQL